VDRDVEISPSPTTALPFEPALDRFLEKAPPHRRAALRSKVRMWRQGADCPPTQKPTDPVLITAMNEYADDPGNWSATHLWTFVRNAIRRYAETSTPPPANGHAPAVAAPEWTAPNRRLKVFLAKSRPRTRRERSADGRECVCQRDGGLAAAHAGRHLDETVIETYRGTRRDLRRGLPPRD